MSASISVTVLAIGTYMTLAYGVATWKRNLGLVDIFWGGGFIIIAVTGLVFSTEIVFRQWLILAMTLIWAFRLAGHIGRRNWTKPEDFRYREMRQRWGRSVWWKGYTHIFLLQGGLMCVVGLPVMAAFMQGQAKLSGLDILGVCIWAAGLAFEWTADSQLRHFLAHEKSPENSVMTRGVWALSRHPNYLGEALLWWGMALVAYNASRAWWVFAGPLTLTLLLRYVSGVPPLEARYKDSAAYQAYAAHTPVFVPGLKPKGEYGAS